MKPDQKKFMKAALAEAKKAEEKAEVPVGAVVVYKGKVISRGHNLRESKQSVLGHAELSALSKASRKLGSWRLVDCDVYVTLEPCVMCAGALQQARVRHVYYGVPDPKGGALSLGFNVHENSKLNHRYGMTCLEMPECGQVLSKFFKSRRGKK
ncbi:MAG: nucleoside deaminase [Bdellovibrionota bacterium]